MAFIAPHLATVPQLQLQDEQPGSWPAGDQDTLAAVEQEAFLQQVLASQGISKEDMVAGDAAVISCLDTATKSHAAFLQISELLSTLPSPLVGSFDDDTPSGSAGGREAGDSSAPLADTQIPPSHSKRKRPPSALLPSGGSGASSLATLAESSLDAAAANKGLKHFSIKVCEKVEEKGSTNYNEVADELVRDLAADAAAGLGDGAHYDEKNVRRRVYDALNVLEALGIITKNKRDIEWRGWPASLGKNSSEKERLEAERAKLAARVDQKLALAQDVAIKAFCLSNLVLRNRDAPLAALTAAQEAGMAAPNPLPIPFMLVHAPVVADVDIHITPDERTARLDFHHWPFQIYDDEKVMRMMGLGEPQPELAEGVLQPDDTAAANNTNNNPMNNGNTIQPTPPQTVHLETTPMKLPNSTGAAGVPMMTDPSSPVVLSPSAAVSAMDLGPSDHSTAMRQGGPFHPVVSTAMQQAYGLRHYRQDQQQQ